MNCLRIAGTKLKRTAAPALLAIVFLFTLTGVLHAQQFEAIPPLNFEMPLGGGNPLPQILVVASTSTNFNYTASTSTSQGGNWLSVSPGGNCCTTPSVETVSISNTSGLTVGTYSGQVTFKSNDGTNTLNVPVTLTVAATNTAFFDSVPSQLSFSMLTSGTAPPAQIFPIRNGGTGKLKWTLTASTADGGKWLKVSANSGTAPSEVTASITLGKLPGGGTVAGRFDGQLLFHSSTGDVTVPVSVTVDANAFAQVNPISFTMPFGGGNPLPQVLMVASTGLNFNYTASSVTSQGGNWLSVSPGGNCCTTPSVETVSVSNAGSLPAGSYSGEVTFRANDGTKAITVPVTLTVAAKNTAFFDSVPSQLSFSMVTNGAAPPAQTFIIHNGGVGALDWTLTTSTADGGNWLALSANSGTAPSELSASITPSQLPGGGTLAGRFDGQFLFHSSTGDITVPVSVTVDANAFAQVNPISFTMPFGGGNPLPQVLLVASAGVNFNYTASSVTSQGGNWLSVSPGGNCCTTPSVETVSVSNAGSLPIGSYSGEVTFRANDGTKAITVPVTLTVAASNTAFFDSVPSQLSFSMQPNGAVPPAQTFAIRNGGTGKLKWTLTTSTADGGAWLTAAPLSGTAPKNVSVQIVPADLPGGGTLTGRFDGQLLFHSNGGDITVPVSVTVDANSFLQVNPISFTMPFGGNNPLPQLLLIATAGVNFNFTASASTAQAANWLSVSPGGNCCSTPSVETASVSNAASLPVGSYSGELTFRANDGTKAITVLVTLTVEPSNKPFFDNVPGQTSFSFTPSSSGNPPSQIVPIANGGSGTLNWVLKTSTADGRAWLKVAPAKGAAPSVVTVTIVRKKLQNKGQIKGSFVGQQVFQTASGTVTVPVNVTIGDSVFVPLGAMTFSTTQGQNPPPQQVTVSSTGTNFNYTAGATSSKGGNWLSVSPGGNCCTTPQLETVSVNATSLGVGTYIGQVSFRANDGTEAMTMPVILTVNP